MNLYEELGVPKSADRATIKRAYRKKAMKLHPDRVGGDIKKFHAVQKAYDVLYDDARRAHYDKHGTDGQQDVQGMLMGRIAALFMQLVENNDVDHVDIVVLMQQFIKDGKHKTQNAIKSQEQKISKYERTKKRVTKKGRGDNLLVLMLEGQIALMRRGLELAKVEIENFDAMLKILDDYGYKADEGPYRNATMQGLWQQAMGQSQW